MKNPRIRRIGLTRWNLPMRWPFVTAHGQKRISKNLLVTVTLEDGTTGRGEASESLAWADQTQQRMFSSLNRLRENFFGQPISHAEALVAETRRRLADLPAAAGALECALLEALAQSEGLPLWRWLRKRAGQKPIRRPSSVTTGLTVSAWPAEQAGRFARRQWAAGFRTFKIKLVGANPDADLERVTAVHRAAPRAALWVDGNQGFSAEGAVRLGLRMKRDRLPVALFEQPVPRGDTEGLHQVQRRLRMPVAADESAATVEQAQQLIRAKQAAVINVKLAKSGLLGAIDILRAARKNGTSLMIGCMAESAVGLSPSVHLACGTGAFRFIDLDSSFLVRSPARSAGFTAEGPVLTVTGRTG